MKNTAECKKIVVVGDKFNAFANGKDVVTISQLDLITQIPAHIIDTKKQFIVGQGIRYDFAEKVLDNQKRNQCHNNEIDLTTLQQLTVSRKNEYAHKKITHNTVIGVAEKVNKNLFSLPLLIDERCELMADHQTGQHIQGMILIEACRQTFIAVTEEFYMSDKVGQSYYVINDMNIKFSNFLFPLPAVVNYELVEEDINDRRSRFKANIHISQHTTLCASMAVTFTVYPEKVISKKEAAMANEITKAILQTQYISTQAVEENVYA
ncbi:AfsA-related hotdog domain-containing protein [Photorhabdus khanii]|uniref:A-factor biosynthesis hotdog domain-containing protein n=1 Tax=Photorhabdus khanii subsp. guanajuatensis TaxID=2100166 RepID=A0A4V2X5F4_9GAMM|nr:AfsA-related hotdog domain-containing protein [Photorhabdus khanii]TDB47995.1 hypothetical protein C5467_19875 [Photorhabdus khanii subsp. guanajuatensis]